ncbi:LysR substrate-binding domain-containing protein [Sodalis sp. RH16]|uniref:LysR substrate-binding domain-containing protein n=1 Tax=Sodalis sp. RH16 TaxID=3394331 RepID=UPI0039B6151D
MWSETGALFRWHFEGHGESIDVDVDSVVTANDTDLLLTAALQGTGLAFLPESFVAARIKSGELIQVLESWCKPFAGFYLYYPSKPHMPAALRAFIDFIKLPASPLAPGEMAAPAQTRKP